MNTQEILNVLKICGATFFGIMAMHGYMSQEQASALMSELTIAVPALLSAGSMAWSIYAHWNMKKVPDTSVAVQPVQTDGTRAADIMKGAVVTGKVVGALLFAFMVFAPHDANAKTCLDPLNKLPIGCTPRQSSPTDTSKAKTLLDLLSQPMQDLAKFINSDFTQAQALANSIPNMPDGNGNSCWAMLVSANAIFKENPADKELPGVATLLEQLRLLGMVANRICQNAACTQVFTEAGNAINSVVPIPNLPSLTTLCSKVPSIAQVAITTAPIISAPAVTASPTPDAK